MLFDTLSEALADIDALQDYNLDHLIKHYGISFQYSSSLQIAYMVSLFPTPTLCSSTQILSIQNELRLMN